MNKKNNINKLINDFEDYLINNLPKSVTFHPYFEDALSYTLKASAKRFRPMLLLCVVRANNTLFLKNAMSVALSLEMIHTYSLIHDDLPSMDNANLRRGLSTLHTKYDEVTAILVGDALNTEAFHLLSQAPFSSDIKIELIKCLSQNAGINGMIIGQAIDCYFENQTLELKNLEFLHIHKTAKLIAASLKMGAIICELDSKVQNDLYNFGLDIGLLFQIQDDIIDETHSSKEAGKTTNNDTNKNSFVNLHGLTLAINVANQLAQKCINTLNNFEEHLKESLKESLLEYIYRHIKKQ